MGSEVRVVPRSEPASGSSSGGGGTNPAPTRFIASPGYRDVQHLQAARLLNLWPLCKLGRSLKPPDSKRPVKTLRSVGPGTLGVLRCSRHFRAARLDHGASPGRSNCTKRYLSHRIVKWAADARLDAPLLRPGRSNQTFWAADALTEPLSEDAQIQLSFVSERS